MGTQLTVLVADDHEVYRALLRTLFESFGCTVTTVEDGAKAVAAIGPFDLICLDRHMPVCDGVAAAKRLAGSAFLVACTSDPGPGLDDFDLVLTKPISCAAICNALDAAQGWRALHTERSYGAGGA